MPRKTNMLEAFRQGLAPTPTPAPKRRPARAPRPARAAGAPAGLAEFLSRPAGLALGALLLFVLGFALGRGTAGALADAPGPRDGDRLALETRVRADAPATGERGATGDGALSAEERAAPSRAAEDPSPAAAGAEPTDPGTAGPGTVGGADDGFTADDRAFLDPANRYTLRVLTCDSTPLGRDLAVASYRHLRANGLPAIVPFLVGDSYYLCVGAVPSTKDPRLVEWKAALRELDGPPPQRDRRPYASAFVVNIDDVVER